MDNAVTRESLTTSEMGVYLSCQRKYWLRYVMRLSPAVKSQALRFGSAWHTAMECRWHQADYETALTTALTQAGDEVDAVMGAQLAGMLAGYYARYGNVDETVAELYAEVPFCYPLAGSRTFDCAGKIDGLGVDFNGKYLLLEHKSSGEAIEDGSDYWLRLKHNAQLYQYITAARHSGWNIERIVYDVARKPMLKPYADAPVLDDAGLKQVMCNGARVYKKDGTPKQSADKDKGESYVSAPETMEAYAQRVADDCKARPDFYFARKDVPIFDADIEEFEVQRLAITKMMLQQRALSRKCKRPEHAWPRNCGGMTCKYCEFATPCLDGWAIDADTVPQGFRRRDAKHEELVVTE